MSCGLPPCADGATRLILVRHGEPDENVRGRCYGRLDPALSPRGCEQMRRSWQMLGGQIAAPVYSSPRRRAVESACLRPSGSSAVSTDERLAEIDFGDFEGLTYADISSRLPEEYAEWMRRPTEVAFPGGESFHTMSARVRAALDDIRRAHVGKTVVIVSHAGVNRVALAAALDLEPQRIFRLDQAYGSVNVIDYVGGEPLVRLVNAVPRL